MKIIIQAAAFGLLATLAACSEGSDIDNSSAEAISSDLDLAQSGAGVANIDQAASSLNAEMRAAAKVAGTGFCGLPELPDVSAQNAIGDDQRGYVTNTSPEDSAAFYRIAAEANGGSAQVAGDADIRIYEISVTTADGTRCLVSTSNSFTGDSQVTIALLS